MTTNNLRKLIKESLSLILCESAEEVADVVAEILPDGPDTRDIAELLVARLSPATLVSFVRSKRDPAAVKAFEAALKAHGEWKIDPKDAWLMAWRGAYLGSGLADRELS